MYLVDSDILSFWTQKFTQETYIGTPFDKIHDFNYNAISTVVRENNMPNMEKCLNTFEIARLERHLGF
jgi:hypothetical protein